MFSAFFFSSIIQEGNVLFCQDRNQIDDPEDTEKVTGDQLKHTNYNTCRIAPRNTHQRTVNVIEDNQ